VLSIDVIDPGQIPESARLVAMDRKRRLPSSDQMTWRRYMQWRHDHEVGTVDPITGKLERRSVAYIASIYGVSVQAVYLGLSRARELTEGITNAARSSAG
jgi:hypothetical protein